MSLDRSIKCPFWYSVDSNKIRCEGDDLRFQSRKETKAYVQTYCGNFKGMETCRVYKQLMAYYDEKDKAVIV